mmetsp:Transcript_61485/g.146666  ORF Transcript_61485/g.146666 Transcript_61485/m.146666 type:complete len:201 (+) Transcript_61485:1598-2200(+)
MCTLEASSNAGMSELLSKLVFIQGLLEWNHLSQSLWTRLIPIILTCVAVAVVLHHFLHDHRNSFPVQGTFASEIHKVELVSHSLRPIRITPSIETNFCRHVHRQEDQLLEWELPPCSDIPLKDVSGLIPHGGGVSTPSRLQGQFLVLLRSPLPQLLQLLRSDGNDVAILETSAAIAGWCRDIVLLIGQSFRLPPRPKLLP